MDGVAQEIRTLLPNRSYILSAYIKTEDASEVQFSLSQKGKVLAHISSHQIEFTNASNWKFVELSFELGTDSSGIVLEITKVNNGTAYIDDAGIIPIPIHLLKLAQNE